MAETCETTDFAASARTFLFFWGLPILALVVAAFFDGPTSVLVSSGALFWMGAACALNAYRCGRLHCYITGPLFLLGGIAVLLGGFEIVSIPSTWIFIAVVGGTCLAYKLESMFRRKYVRPTEGT